MAYKNRLVDELAGWLERAKDGERFSAEDWQLFGQLQGWLRRYRVERCNSLFYDCPRCGKDLQPTRINGATANQCTACGGMWIDRGMLPDFIESSRSQAIGEPSARVSLRDVWPEGVRYSSDRLAKSGP